MFRSSFPSPTSTEYEPMDAFHRLSGEHGGTPPHVTFPVLFTSNGWATKPMFVVVVVFAAYRMRTFPITVSSFFSIAVRKGALDRIRATNSSLSPIVVNSSGTYPPWRTLSVNSSPLVLAGSVKRNRPETSDLPEARPERLLAVISAPAIGACFLGSLSSTSTTPLNSSGFLGRSA